MADVEKAAPYLSDAQCSQLREDFRFLLDAGQLEKEWTRAYFAQRMCMSQRKEEYKKRAEVALRDREALDRTPGVLYGLDADTGHRYFIDIFVAKMRRRMSLPDEAKAEDDVRLEKVRLKLDVDRN